ncbi:MAG: hypothetical protein CMM02_03225 [Rhodopirellula sp.]|nr:hypothetical protein [Rhodopirellula sp.]
MLICFFVLIIGIFIISNYNIKLIEKYTDASESCSVVKPVGRDFGGTYCDGLTVNSETIFAVDRNPNREEAETALRNKLQEECNKNPQCKGFTTFVDNQYTVTDQISNNWFLDNYLKKKYKEENKPSYKIYQDYGTWKENNDLVVDRNSEFHVPIGKLCIDGWGGSLRNHPEFGETFYGEPPSVGYEDFKKHFKVEGHDDPTEPRYLIRKPKNGKMENSYLNLRTYRCQDKCPAGQGVQSTTPEEKAEYGDFKCSECPDFQYSLSHEKECKPCNNSLCQAGTVMIECDKKTGGVVCGPASTTSE